MSYKPTPSEMIKAFNDHGVDYKTYARWDTRGGTWGAYGGGLDGIVMHHTSTPSATGSSGCPTLYWCAESYDWAISNVVLGRGKGDTYFLSAKPSYHSGDGGPWPAIGINQAANVGHIQLFGIEIDDRGQGQTLTDYQVENAARIAAALSDLCGWPKDNSRIITHGDWTDSGPYLGTSNYGPYRYRKNDTLRQYYDQKFWREQASKYMISAQPTWDGTIPKRSAAMLAFNDRELKNQASWRLACRLYDLKFRDKPALDKGEQKYPSASMKAFQASVGLPDNGDPNKETWIKLFGKDKP